jgi:hypothetical protein
VRRKDGAAVLVNSAVAAIEHDHSRMRTRARRKEQRTHDALRADWMPRHTRAGHAALKREFSTHTVRAGRFELNEPGQHDEVGGRRFCVARQSFR